MQLNTAKNFSTNSSQSRHEKQHENKRQGQTNQDLQESTMLQETIPKHQLQPTSKWKIIPYKDQSRKGHQTLASQNRKEIYNKRQASCQFPTKTLERNHQPKQETFCAIERISFHSLTTRFNLQKWLQSTIQRRHPTQTPTKHICRNIWHNGNPMSEIQSRTTTMVTQHLTRRIQTGIRKMEWINSDVTKR